MQRIQNVMQKTDFEPPPGIKFLEDIERRNQDASRGNAHDSD